MALFLEDSQKVTNRKIPIPKNAQKIFSALYNALEPNMGKNQLKNLKNLATDKTYNKKGENSNTNGKDANVNYVDVEVAKKRMQRWPQNQLQQMAQGGQLAYDTYKKGVERARSQEKVQAVEPPKPTSDADTKPSDVKLKKIEMPSGTITYNENRVIKESDDWHVYYDYMEDYGAYYILSQFFNNPQGKEDWGVLINPEMYVKALREFTQYGKLVNFPTKYVYQWMGIIMKNTAMLEANTDLAGHSTNFPIDEVVDFAESRGVELEADYDSCSEWLGEQGLYDWMNMPDGSDAWSDYGLEPLFNIIKEFNEELPAEKVLVLVNRALDIGHQRGDLASIFIQGGSKVLTRISEEINKNNKKVYITEEQLINLKNG
jgi:uncharacterized protein YozE (UPF0346 family)